MLQSILSQFPLNPTLIQSLTGNLAPKEKDPWPGTIPFSTETPGYFAADLSQLEALEKLKSLKEASSLAGVAGSFGGNSQNQLANILTAAAKLKQVAEQATSKLNYFPSDGKFYSSKNICYCFAESECGQGPGEQSSGPGSRKLAFHEPRPCPVCRRVYRDAATLRTHTAIMHSEGAEPFRSGQRMKGPRSFCILGMFRSFRPLTMKLLGDLKVIFRTFDSICHETVGVRNKT